MPIIAPYQGLTPFISSFAAQIAAALNSLVPEPIGILFYPTRVLAPPSSVLGPAPNLCPNFHSLNE